VASRNGAGPRQREHAGETRKANNAFGNCVPPSSRSPNSPQAHFAVTDGRDALGTVDQIDGAFVALDINGVIVGRFPTLRQAVRAFDNGGVR
jgi:hypothetical protein